jgi:hypothetical protein
MKNSINKQFKMTQGAHSDNDTPSGFRNYAGVAQAGGTSLNMGEPLNYGTPDSPTPKTDPDKDKPASSKVGPDGMTDYARKRKAKIEAGKKKQAALAKKRAEAKKKRESGEYKGPSGRAGDFNFLGIKGNVKRYGEGG